MVRLRRLGRPAADDPQRPGRGVSYAHTLDHGHSWEAVPPGSLVVARPGDVQVRPLTTTGDHA